MISKECLGKEEINDLMNKGISEKTLISECLELKKKGLIAYTITEKDLLNAKEIIKGYSENKSIKATLDNMKEEKGKYLSVIGMSYNDLKVLYEKEKIKAYKELKNNCCKLLQGIIIAYNKAKGGEPLCRFTNINVWTVEGGTSEWPAWTTTPPCAPNAAA
jgi:hypothetical protein